VSRIGDTIVDEKALNFVAARVATGSGDARQMMELVSKAVEHKKRSLSELALKAPAPQKPLVTIRDAVQAIKASAPENYSKQIESLPEMAKLVLCVAVSMCKEYPENFSFKKLRSYCSFAAEKEFGDSIDLDTFMSLMQLLVDQGLIMPNRDGDNNLNSQGFGALLEKKVHFGAQLQDVENAVIDMLTEKPIYQRLVDHARENQPK
jgi:Cdc6-like AAA superfamily ATPase